MAKLNAGYFKSTVGQKQIVGLMGLLLCGFVFTHMLGNLIIFIGPEAYNMYAYKLVSNPLIYVAEAGLVAMFVGHIVLTIKLTIHNKKSRPQAYAVSASGEKKTTLVQKTMAHQGIIILVFLILHLITFKWGTVYTVEYDGLVVRDLFQLMVEKFNQPLYVVGYLGCLVILTMHLSHGFQSSFKSLGFNHPQYEPKIKCAGFAYAAFVGFGFISQPLYIFFFL
mgnify:FL=1|tara:strand:- start:104776 stop:105444 length:669 start_codon:yes stop_codon:yes gene_type:complete